MNLMRRNGQVVYEDLLKELEVIEQRLLPEDSAAAMSLMVLETKLRERFQKIDMMMQGRHVAREDVRTGALVRMDVNALIPRDLPCYSDLEDADGESIRARTTVETVGVAALLALLTACAVFGLASAVQMMVSWLA